MKYRLLIFISLSIFALPAADAFAAQYDIPVLSLRYFPLSGGNLDPAITGMTDSLASIRLKVDRIRDETMVSLEQGSTYHGYKNPGATPSLDYEILEENEFISALPLGAEVPWKPGQQVYRPDYIQILLDLNICDYVDNQGVKEVWMWGYHTGPEIEIAEAPYTEPVESNMAMGTDSQSFWNYGTYGDVSNSERTNDMPTCANTYTLYNYNYGRDVPETLENHGHHLESVFRFIDLDLFWNKFVNPFGEQSQTNSCGWTHSPPNTKNEYDWGNTQLMQSDCEDWQPDGGGVANPVNCETWGGGVGCPNANTGFKIWWMQNMPGTNNGLTYQGENIRDWWDFIGDFDIALSAGKSFTVPWGEYNASGFAWSENIGWVSFNCTDQGTCGGVDYGVNVRDDNYLEGYAWSSNIGWISFNLADTGAPPDKYDYSNQGYIAKLQATQLRGWARALAGMDDPNDGWDGWIKLTSHPSDSGPSYGVTYDISSSEFSGWAWGDDVIGWLSFNCDNEGTCGTSDYKVIADTNQPPSASSLTKEDNYSGAGNACLSPPDHTFAWNFSDSDGDPQTAYQLQIDDSPTFASMPEEGGTPDAWDMDTGKVLTPTPIPVTERIVNVVIDSVLSATTIGYNRTYYWRIKVWDQVEDSGWILPNPSNSPFNTALHVYPTSLFSFSPTSPSEGEEITFTQISECYDINNIKGPCPAVDGNYRWDFDYPPFNNDDVGQSVKHTYTDTNTHTIALDTTDADGQTCRGEGDLVPQAPLPEFKETSPTSFFQNMKNFLASISSEFHFDMFNSLWTTTTKNL